MKFCTLVLLLLGLDLVPLRAQSEAAGVLLFQEPATTYTEAVEYRSFRQDNALYATVVTAAGQPKKLKASAVIKAVAYPPFTLDPAFEDLAGMNLREIAQLEERYPRVRPQLETARGKWERALAVFRQNKAEPGAAVQGKSTWPKGARLTSATADSATVTDATGVRTFPLATLSAAQVLALNATSRTLQLPLGVRTSGAPAETGTAGKTAEPGGLTQHVEKGGRKAIATFSKTLGISDRAFSVWTFFVILPALVLILLIALVASLRRGVATVLPQRRTSL